MHNGTGGNKSILRETLSNEKIPPVDTRPSNNICSVEDLLNVLKVSENNQKTVLSTLNMRIIRGVLMEVFQVSDDGSRISNEFRVDPT